MKVSHTTAAKGSKLYLFEQLGEFMPCTQHTRTQILEAFDDRIEDFISRAGTVGDATRPADIDRLRSQPLSEAYLRSVFSPCDRDVLTRADIRSMSRKMERALSQVDDLLTNDSVLQRMSRTGSNLLRQGDTAVRYLFTDVVQGGSSDPEMPPLTWGSLGQLFASGR